MSESDRMRTLTSLGTAALVATLGWTAATPSKAAEAREQLRQQFDSNLKGKKVAWAPVWLGVLSSNGHAS